FLIIIAQFFGFFPVQGVSSDEVQSLKFSWISIRVVLSLVMCFIGWFECFANIRFMVVRNHIQFQQRYVFFLFHIFSKKLATAHERVCLFRKQTVEVWMAQKYRIEIKNHCYYIFSFRNRFQQIRKHLQRMKKNETKSVHDWKIIREDYNHLSRLCLLTNDYLANLILISFFNNIYFILFHVYRTLTVKQTRLELAYFVICFGLLILRTTCVCWFAGSVNEESRAPLRILTSVAHTVHNVEIERFIDEIRYKNPVTS
ncbi:Trehalose recp domain containing protein, partial [Asbolus verrucosus]